jgi:YesN/AraC family two-component response regulator
MLRAFYLINQSKMGVYEIGDVLGIKNGEYFSRQFKKAVGISPSELRKKDRLIIFMIPNFLKGRDDSSA